jgi:molybdate transport system substrate-binding protein
MRRLLAFALLFTGAFAGAQEIVVAAAADMSAALPQLVTAYTKKTGQMVKVSFGSSGNLTNQIRNGAPFDVFFSADEKISIANPATAPYGRAAEAALRHFGIYDQVSSRLVLGENVSQAAQFVESGNAQAGLIALSHALAPAMKDKGRYWTVPLDAYPTLNQAAVVLSKSKQQDAARKFLEFVRSSEASSLLTSYGFSLPAETH